MINVGNVYKKIHENYGILNINYFKNRIFIIKCLSIPRDIKKSHNQKAESIEENAVTYGNCSQADTSLLCDAD